MQEEEDLILLLINKEKNEPATYPMLLRSLVTLTTEEELREYVVVERTKEGGRRLLLSEKGAIEVDTFVEMMSRPAKKKKFTQYAKLLSMFSRKPKEEERKLVINSWEEAKEKNLLPKYFEGRDYLGLFPMSPLEEYKCDVNYKNDYEECVRVSFNPKVIAEKYIFYLESKVELMDGDLVYDVDTLQLAAKSLAQRDEYTSVLEDYADIIIPSDGLGVFSAMCILRGTTYKSWEPNKIGDRARALGLITSQNPIYEEKKTYVFFYCVQYYQLPFFPDQHFVVLDVPTIKKPGFNKNLHSSTSHKNMKVSYLYPPDPMQLSSAYSLDVVATRALTVMSVRLADPVQCQFIVASSASSFEASMHAGFFVKEKWELAYDRVDNHTRRRFPTFKDFFRHIKEKTLLLFDRSFPFRSGFRKRWNVQQDGVRREKGPGWHCDGQALWYGNNFSPGEEITQYVHDGGYFIIKPGHKPKLILYIKLYDYLVDIYGVSHLRVSLVSVYKVGPTMYAVYVPEQKIIRKPILIDAPN